MKTKLETLKSLLNDTRKKLRFNYGSIIVIKNIYIINIKHVTVTNLVNTQSHDIFSLLRANKWYRWNRSNHSTQEQSKLRILLSHWLFKYHFHIKSLNHWWRKSTFQVSFLYLFALVVLLKITSTNQLILLLTLTKTTLNLQNI